MIVAAPDDTIVIYFAANDGLMCHVGRAGDDWSEGGSFRFTSPEFSANDATKPDRWLLAEENILSFTADSRAGQEGSGFAFLDWNMERLVDPEATD